jgi:4-amino-4-deoxy-L-arabinose transferase-like glycosyltransferase
MQVVCKLRAHMPAPTVRAPLLVGLTLAVNALVLVFPAIYGDAATYALVSKNMVVSGNWVNLTFMGTDWLDKPHFPFWITAFSFRLFGTNGFAYLLPGLLFHTLGVWYTYRLAKHFYDRETGLLAAVISLTAVRLLWSIVDLRAEAYLFGQITAALYYWMKYDEQAKPTHLVAGAAFTAMAIMTKGLFVLGAIGGGLLCDFVRRRDWRGLVSPKWMLAVALCFVFILPELIALYLQFDRHPEKVVFGHTGVSGIRFFFWDSQFGRFFNTGPITAGGRDPIFFIHTFLWAFLPWTFLFFGAVAVFLRRRKQLPDSEVRPFVVLSMSFLIPFVFFSLTRFQLDHYLDIVLPFAAILSARFFLRQLPELRAARLTCSVQVGMAVIMAMVTFGLCLVAFRTNTGYVWLTLLPIALLAFAAFRRADPPLSNAVILPVLATNVVFAVLVVANHMYFERYDATYKLARVLDGQPDLVVYDYRTSSKTLGFYSRQHYVNVERLDDLDPTDPRGCFIMANDAELDDVLMTFPSARVVARASGIPNNRLAPRMLTKTRWYGDLETTRLVLVRTGGSTAR